MRNHMIGLLAGFVAGLVDCAIFAASGMAISLATAGSGIVFWMTVGWTIHNIAMPVPAVFKGVIVALFMSTPWIIELVGNQGGGDLLAPILIVAVCLGSILGLVSAFIGKRWPMVAV